MPLNVDKPPSISLDRYFQNCCHILIHLTISGYEQELIIKKEKSRKYISSVKFIIIIFKVF